MKATGRTAGLIDRARASSFRIAPACAPLAARRHPSTQAPPSAPPTERLVDDAVHGTSPCPAVEPSLERSIVPWEALADS